MDQRDQEQAEDRLERRDRKQRIPVGPPPDSKIVNLANVVFFRGLAICLILHQRLGISPEFHAELLYVGMLCFFVPGQLKRENGWVKKLAQKWIGVDSTDDEDGAS